jgi:UDP-N-acetylglucosamine 2-epimerase (non-hydrolysing)
MNPRVREIAAEEFLGCESIRLIEPLDVIDFHNFMARSYIIVTDSGGVQEEASALGVPTLVTRDTTERQEGIVLGNLRLIGCSEESVYKEIKAILEDKERYDKMSHITNVYGDGRASQRIADIIIEK